MVTYYMLTNARDFGLIVGMTHFTENNDRIVRRPELEKLVGLKKSQIYSLIADGLFPKPIRIGKRAVGWPLSELKAWIDSRPRAGHFAEECQS